MTQTEAEVDRLRRRVQELQRENQVLLDDREAVLAAARAAYASLALPLSRFHGSHE